MRAGALPPLGEVAFRVGVPGRPEFGDLTADVAIVLARRLGRSPEAIAAVLLRYVRDPAEWFAAVEVGGPGFVNFRLASGFRWAQVTRILAECGAQPPPPLPVMGLEPMPAPDATWVRAAAAAGAVGRLAARRTAVDPRPAWVVLPGERGAVARDKGRRAGGRMLHVGAVRVVHGSGDDAGGLAAIERVIGRAGACFVLLAGPLAQPLELDADEVVRQTMESPLFSIRYALARCDRVTAVAPWAGEGDLRVLGDSEAVLAGVLAAWPDVVADAAEGLAAHRVAAFAVGLAAAFHGYYNRSPIVTDDRTLTRARVVLVRGVQQVLGAALGLLGARGGDGS